MLLKGFCQNDNVTPVDNLRCFGLQLFWRNNSNRLLNFLVLEKKEYFTNSICQIGFGYAALVLKDYSAHTRQGYDVLHTKSALAIR